MGKSQVRQGVAVPTHRCGSDSIHDRSTATDTHRQGRRCLKPIQCHEGVTSVVTSGTEL